MPSSSADERYVIREYRTSDDDKCRDIERHASQGSSNPLARLLLKAQFTHSQAFDAKANQFERGHVIVCEDIADGAIVGVVMIGIKHGWLCGRKQTLGYMFDLRVHERVQRGGLGTRLCEAAEAKCLADGVDTLYLSVNEPNKKARALYNRLGYSECSRRAPATLH